MKTIHDNKRYVDGGAEIKWNKDFDFLLHRQDWKGAEGVYFNDDEIDEIIEMISKGQILMNPSYSVLIIRKHRDIQKYEQIFGCVCVTSDNFKGGK